MAVNCWLCPATSDVVPVMVIDFNEGVTVTVAVPVTPESAVVIVLVPALTAVTRPLDETVATAASDEIQVADDVKSLVLPSL